MAQEILEKFSSDNLEELKEEAYAETGDIRTLIQKVAPTYHPKEN